MNDYGKIQTLFNITALFCAFFEPYNVCCLVFGGSKFEKLGVDKERYKIELICLQ